MARSRSMAAASLAWLVAGCSHAQPLVSVSDHGPSRAHQQQARHEHRLGALEASVVALEARLQTLQAQLRAQADGRTQVPTELSVERWLPGPASDLGELLGEPATSVVGRGSALRVEP